MSRPVTQADIDSARALVMPLMHLLRGQSGGTIVLNIPAPDGHKGSTSLVAAHLRKLRRALWPMSKELAAISGCNYRPETEGERRRLRALEYPEPITPRFRDPSDFATLDDFLEEEGLPTAVSTDIDQAALEVSSQLTANLRRAKANDARLDEIERAKVDRIDRSARDIVKGGE